MRCCSPRWWGTTCGRRMSEPKRILILGSTGSIGTQALDVCARESELEVVGLSAERSWEELLAQAHTHEVTRVALADADAAARSATRSFVKMFDTWFRTVF